MATLNVSSALMESNAMFVWISGLDSSYNQSIRTATYSAMIGSTVISSSSESIPNLSSSSGGVWLSGLSPNTTYTVKCVISNITGSPDVTLWSSGTTLPGQLSTPTGITTTTPTMYGFTVSWNAVANATGYDISIGGLIITNVSSTSYYLSGTAGSTYTVCVAATASGWTKSGTACVTRTLPAPARPSNWSWTYAKTQGGDIYSVSGKNLNIMPASEWNSFTARINDFRTYKSYYTNPFTSVISGTNFTASIVNEAIGAINELLPIANRMSTVSQGDMITAAVFNTMRDKLNSIT